MWPVAASPCRSTPASATPIWHGSRRPCAARWRGECRPQGSGGRLGSSDRPERRPGSAGAAVQGGVQERVALVLGADEGEPDVLDAGGDPLGDPLDLGGGHAAYCRGPVVGGREREPK